MDSLHAFFRCVRIWFHLAANSAARQLEFKANLIGRTLVECVWISSQILVFTVAFRFVPTLGGWSEGELWFFVGTTFVVDGLFMIFYYDNQTKFGQILRNGTFDFYLIYPLPTIFLANFRFVNPSGLINVSLGMAVLLWGVHLGHLAVLWPIWLLYIIVGAVIVLALGTLVQCIGFWTTMTSNLSWLFFELYRLSFRPESFYRTWLRRFLLTVFPMAFFISIPVQLALGKIGGAWFAYPFMAALGFWTVTVLVWKRGLKLYEGALS